VPTAPRIARRYDTLSEKRLRGIRMAGDSASRNKVTIKIPRPLYDMIALLIEGAGYNSVTDFVVYVLRDIVASSHEREEEPYTEAELEDVKERLRQLGYL